MQSMNLSYMNQSQIVPPTASKPSVQVCVDHPDVDVPAAPVKNRVDLRNVDVQAA